MAGLDKRIIRLRPHHVQRLFYDWQGEDFIGKLSKIMENDIPKYDESTLHQIKAVYDALFFDNVGFVITPEIDDICERCNVRKSERITCICPDNTLFLAGFSAFFGINFEQSYDICFCRTTSQLKYEPTAYYVPFDVLRQGITGLRQAVAWEHLLPKGFQDKQHKGEIENKIKALEATFEELRRVHGCA